MAFAIHSNPGAFGGLVTRDALRELARFQRSFAPLASQSATPSGFVPRIDAVEDAHAFHITAEVPGIAEADLSVEVEDGVLTLKGEKKSYFAAGSAAESDAEVAASAPRFHRSETQSGHFERRLRFTTEVDEAAIQATYRNGVLRVVVPKIPEVAPAIRTVPVQSA